MSNNRNLCIVGHRGAEGYELENTKKSFLKAIELGCCRTELDVRLTKDGVPIVMHDSTFDRVTDGTGEVSSKNFSEVRQIRCDDGEPVSTLEEIIKVCKEKIGLQIELKIEADAKPVSDLIKKYGIEKYVIISSFERRALEWFSKLMPTIPTMFLSKESGKEFWDLADRLGVKYVGLHEAIIDKRIVSRVKDNNQVLYAFHVNTLERGKELIDMGVKEIGTPYPALFLA